jgi:hypothetical protein
MPIVADDEQPSTPDLPPCSAPLFGRPPGQPMPPASSRALSAAGRGAMAEGCSPLALVTVKAKAAAGAALHAGGGLARAWAARSTGHAIEA